MVIKMINKLIQFDLDEKLFREYYYLEKTAKNIQDFKLKYQDDAYNLNIVLNPEILQTHSLEEDYFEKNQDIIILKHPRYIPFFIHDHDYFEIMYILKRNAIQTIEDKVVELQAGHLFLLAPQIKHGIKVFNDETVLLNILIRKSTFLDTFSDYMKEYDITFDFFLSHYYAKDKISYLHFHSQEDIQIQNIILQMYQENNIQDSYSNTVLCHLFSLLLAYIQRKNQENTEITTNIEKNENLKIIQYINDHYKTISLEKISQHFHYSIPYCSKWIKEKTGYSYYELLTHIKLQKGKQLLLNTTLSISQISKQLSYKNPESFIRTFKKYEAITPQAYRKNEQ